MGVFLNRVIHASFDEVLSSIGRCLDTEGYRLMTDINAQNEYRDRNGDEFQRFVVFENRLNGVLRDPGKPTDDPSLRMASTFTIRELNDGSSEIVGFDPTLPFNVDEENLDRSRRGARHLRTKIENSLDGPQ